MWPSNLSISTTLLLFNLVTTHVLHLWSLLLAHLPSHLWKSLITVFGMLHLVYGMNSPLIFASLVRHSLSLLHVHLSQFIIFTIFTITTCIFSYSFSILFRTQDFGSSANPFLHRPFPFLPHWLYGLSDHLMFLFCSTDGFVCMVC